MAKSVESYFLNRFFDDREYFVNLFPFFFHLFKILFITYRKIDCIFESKIRTQDKLSSLKRFKLSLTFESTTDVIRLLPSIIEQVFA